MRYNQVHLPQITAVNKYLIVASAILLFFNSALVALIPRWNLQFFFALNGQDFFAGHIYQILTYPFIPQGLFPILFDGLILWFIGSELESRWGMKQYMRLMVVTILGGGVFLLLIGLLFSKSPVYISLVSGMSGISGALCVLFGLLYPHRTMFLIFFPIKAKYLALILLGMNIYQGLFTSGMAMAWMTIGSCIGAFLWTVNFARFFYRPKKKKKRRGHLTLVDNKFEWNKDDDDDNVTYH